LDRSVKFNTLFETVTQCVGKILLFWFCEGLACAVRAKADVPFAGRHKITRLFNFSFSGARESLRICF